MECNVWACWEAVSDGPGTVWEDCDAGWEDPEGENLEGPDDEEWEDF